MSTPQYAVRDGQVAMSEAKRLPMREAKSLKCQR